jgi:predicted Ser/Thr protein kinase/predicted ATPase
MAETPRQPDRDGFPIQSRYVRLGEAIGRGGIGVVFKAYDNVDDRLVALKVLRAATDASVDMLLNEVEWLRMAVHPCIGRLLDVERDDRGTAFLVMEFIEGESLARILEDRPRELTLDRSLHVAYQLASALQYLHDLEREVIHFDVKPSNVLVLADWSIKLIDFGMARSRWAPAGSLWRQDPIRAPGFTWEYVAPEVAFGAELGEGFRSVDKRADTWSFGLVLWECLAHERPFGEARGRAYAEAAARRPLPLERLPDVPREIETLLVRCLEKRPGDRFRDIGEALPTLRDARVGAGERAVATNLVGDLTPFLGRNAEMRRLADLVATNRVVALQGFPGVGRSRLARAVVGDPKRVPKDVGVVVWVSLSALPITHDPDEVEHAVISALRSVRWRSIRPPAGPATTGEPLYRWLGEQRALVVLDEADALMPQALVLATRLATTNARVLFIGSECAAPGIATLPLRGLRSPPAAARTADELRLSEAGALFSARAEAATGRPIVNGDPTLSAVRIVRLLDGNALALELAAAELALLSIDELERQVAEMLEGSSSAPNHAPLDRMIDTILGRLPDAERTLLARLAIFRGGWTRDAAYAICTDDPDRPGGRATVDGEPLEIALRSLINRSLVVRDPLTRRYALSPLLRSRAEALRDATDRDGADRRLRERARLRYLVHAALGPDGQATPRPDTRRLAALTPERENLIAALSFAASSGEDRTLAWRLLREAAYVSWAAERTHPLVAHFRRAAAIALDPAGGIDDLDLRIGLLNSVGIALLEAAPDVARRALEEGLRLAEPGGPHAWRRYALLTNLGLVEKHACNVEASIARQREALAELEPSRAVDRDAVVLNLGVALKLVGRKEEAEPMLRDLEGRFETRGDHVRLASVRQSLGEMAISDGRIDEGLALLRRGRHRGAPWEWRARRALWLGVGLALSADAVRARRLLEFGTRLFSDRGEPIAPFHLVHAKAAARVLDGSTRPR